ncbi:PAS domain-containing protein [uncultured Polaribacter sp.]|uniref:sensor histidine kinase n=1 Tax=uncultured Polaribacter sp. TaxID=174711 RepID=UPI00261DD8A8|nr:PAS domain-containing protein [uncultured Polaribacter sp.]
MSNKKLTYQDLEQEISRLKQSENRFKMLLKASEDMITIHKPNGKYIYYNEPNCYPITAKGIVGKMPSDLFTKEISNTLFDAFKRVKQTGNSETIEVYLDWLGEKRWFSEYIYPLKNDKGDVIELVKVCKDIHKRKIAEQVIIEQNIEKELQVKELELSKKKIQTTLELVKENEYSLKEAGRMAKIGYWKFDILTDTLFWSDAIYQIFGSDPKFGVPSIEDILNVFSQKSKKILLESLEIFAKKGESYDIELELTNLKKEKRWVRNIGEPTYNDKNEIIGRRGVLQDITALKLNEINLNQKNQKLFKLNNTLNQAQKLSHIGSWQWNMLTDTAEWSDEMYNIYGVNKDFFNPSHENVQKLALPQDLYKINNAVNSLSEGKVFFPFDFRIKRPSGEIRHLYIIALEMSSKENVFGVTKDITDRKRIEEENLRIKDNYIRLFDNASISICNVDLSLIFDQIDELRKIKISDILLYVEQRPEILFKVLENLKVNKVNNATLKLFKAKNNEEYLNNVTETFGEGADKVFIKLIASIWNKEKSFTSEINYKTLKGDEFSAIISIPIPATKLEQKTVPISIQSIQKIKDAELEKRKSLNRLKESQEIAHVGSWLFDLTTNKLEWSEETYRIWGFDIEKPMPKREEVLNRIHKDDQKLFYNTIQLIYDNGIPFDIEFRICLPNNEVKNIKSICKPIFGKNGKVISLKGINQDLTEQKKIRSKIEKVEEMYRLITDNSNDLICLQEVDSTFKYISPSIKTILGYKQDDFIGKKVFNIVHPDDISSFKDKMYAKEFDSKKLKKYTLRVRHKNGSYVWLEFLSSPVYKDNKINFYVTSSRDITQWKLAQKEIQEYQSSLQKMTTEMTLIEEKQKKEIASNIHDHLSQSLVISKMKINELKKKPELDTINKDLLFVEKHISEVLEKSRRITYELSPPVLYQLGIIDALNWLLEDVEATHKIKCRVNTNVSVIKLSDITSILVYRSIQELVKNILKYANATLIKLDITKNKLGVNIVLTDDGVGFNTTKLKNYKGHSGSGFGLFAVKERVRNIQGKFTIKSKINIGTSVNIFIPII